jgi:putative AlgH/UPF0301 family transcriptional regulator
MALRKVCFFVTLVVVAACALVRMIDVQSRQIDVLTPNSQPHPLAVVPDESVWYTGQRANELVRSNWVAQAKTETPSTIYLPVQSKNFKDVGAGRLLVASRALADPNFAETVILLVHCDAEGVVGLVLNRRTDIPLSRVLDQFPAAKDRSDPAFLGGPVEIPAVLALLQSKNKLDGAEQIFSGVYLVSTKPVFEKALSARPDAGIFHVYLGYAGWNNDQLREEVQRGSWFIFQGDARTVFDSDPDSLWRKMIARTELNVAGSAESPVLAAIEEKPFLTTQPQRARLTIYSYRSED